MRQQPAALLGQCGDARVVALDRPQGREYGGRRRDRRAVVAGQPVPQGVDEVVLLGPDPVEGREEVAFMGRVVVRHTEVAGPREETADHAVGLPGRLPVGGAELPYGLQHPETRPRRGVGDLEQRLVGQVREHPEGVVLIFEEVARGVRRESAGEDGQRPQRRLSGRIQQIPAPVDDGVQRTVAAGRVPRAAAQQGEPVLQAAGDLRDRHDPDPRGRQLHRERQPVQVAAQLLDGVGGQIGAGPYRPRPLLEQLDRRRPAQLRQQIHGLGGQAERRPARGEHPQVLRHGHQVVHQVGGGADDVLAVVQHQQHGPGAEGGQDAAGDVRRQAQMADRANCAGRGLTDSERRRDLPDHVLVGGDAREPDEVHGAPLGPAAHG
ncbi:hypothetical protein AB4Z54_04285, partial [Streptomyces sp. MCAF7]